MNRPIRIRSYIMLLLTLLGVMLLPSRVAANDSSGTATLIITAATVGSSVGTINIPPVVLQNTSADQTLTVSVPITISIPAGENSEELSLAIKSSIPIDVNTSVQLPSDSVSIRGCHLSGDGNLPVNSVSFPIYNVTESAQIFFAPVKNIEVTQLGVVPDIEVTIPKGTTGTFVLYFDISTIHGS
jgi:hypothetical protein